MSCYILCLRDMTTGGEWKKWAKYVSEKTGYNIKRCDGDETEEDLARFFGTYVENQSE